MIVFAAPGNRTVEHVSTSGWECTCGKAGEVKSVNREFSAVIISVGWLTGCDVVDMNVGWTAAVFFVWPYTDPTRREKTIN